MFAVATVCDYDWGCARLVYEVLYVIIPEIDRGTVADAEQEGGAAFAKLLVRVAVDRALV